LEEFQAGTGVRVQMRAKHEIAIGAMRAPGSQLSYFEPKYEEFRLRTIWSLSNAFTSAFKELDPIPQFKAVAKRGEFLEARFSQRIVAHDLG
jgi:hypothetical protein